MNDTTPDSFQEPQERPITPCPQMRTLLSQMADGTLRGLLARFARAHIARCAHCREALAALQGVVQGLRYLMETPPPHNASAAPDGLAPERWTSVTRAMEETEAQRNHSSS